MKMKLVVVAVFAMFSVVVLSSFTPQAEGQKTGAAWSIPDTYKTKVNSFSADESLVKVGKMIYMKQCRACHGTAGLGDGPKARGLKTFPGNFKDAKFLTGNDGELYYKTIVGRDEMPNFEGKIPDDEDRWALIMYIKTLK